MTVVQVQIYSEMSLQNCWSVQMMPLLNISFCVFSQELLHLHHQTHRRYLQSFLFCLRLPSRMSPKSCSHALSAGSSSHLKAT